MQPGSKHLVEQAIGLGVGQDGKRGIDACLDRTLAEQVGAKRMDGADVRFFEIMHGGVEQPARIGLRRGFRARPLELFAEPQLQFAGGLLAERDGDDFADRCALVFDQGDDPANELGGLAGTGGGLDN